MTLNRQEVYIISPKEATNLITNPSFELGTTGYTAQFGAIAQTTTYARRGVTGGLVTPSDTYNGVSRSESLTSGVVYSFSADVLDRAGGTFFITIYDGGTLKAQTTWAGTGYWKRRSVTWTADASKAFTLLIYCLENIGVWVTDGWQLEVGAVSTYLDGDMTGYVNGATDYRWNGTPHASTSWRSGMTRSGGTYVKLSDYGKILAIIGLGMGTLNNIAIPSSTGGSYYQTTVPQDRPFSIVEQVYSSTVDYAYVEKNLAVLTNAVKPDCVTVPQPLLMQIDHLDANGLELAETLEFPCVYEGGLEGASDGNPRSGEKVALNFKTYLPMLTQQGEKGVALGYQTAIANANYGVWRNAAGTWAAISSSLNGIVYCILPAPDGTVYVAGNFTNLGGANGDYIVKWTPGGAFTALGTGASGGYVRKMVLGADGTLYAGGTFTAMGGAANTNQIAQWNGSSWSGVGTGVTGTGNVFALAIGTTGILYAAGSFSQMGGVANTAQIAQWDGSNWSALGTGCDGSTIWALAVGYDGTLYSGSGALMDGVADTLGIAKWNGSAWTPLSTGLFGGALYALAIGPDGSLYAGGGFNTAGGVASPHLARWNGVSWSALGSGVNDEVWSLAFGPDNVLYVGGIFTTAGGITLPDRMAVWNGSAWTALDINLSGTPYVHTIAFDNAGNLYIGSDVSGTATSATVTTTNVGTTKAYPKVVYTGPGTVYQLKNFTSGKSIYFGNNLTLFAGEVATLNLDPNHINFSSNYRSQLLKYILPGSNLDFELLPGANNVSSYMFGSTTAASGIVMTWRDGYHDLWGAVR